MRVCIAMTVIRFRVAALAWVARASAIVVCPASSPLLTAAGITVAFVSRRIFTGWFFRGFACLFSLIPVWHSGVFFCRVCFLCRARALPPPGFLRRFLLFFVGVLGVVFALLWRRFRRFLGLICRVCIGLIGLVRVVVGVFRASTPVLWAFSLVIVTLISR